MKSILDVGATLERLETLNVTVLGYGTDAFPGFYLADSGFPVPWRVDSPGEVAAVIARAGRRSGSATRAIVVANPLPAAEQLDPELHDARAAEALAAAARAGVARQGRDAVPARPLPPRDRRREPRGQRARSCCATPRSAAQIAARPPRREPPVVVVGDLMVDVVARGAARSRTAATPRRAIALPAGRRGRRTSRRGSRRRRAGDARRRASATTPRRATPSASCARTASTLAVERRSERPTGTCVVLVDAGGERTMLPDAGANDALARDCRGAAPAARTCT